MEAIVAERIYEQKYIFNKTTPGASTAIIANVEDVDGNTSAGLTAYGRVPTVFYVELCHSAAGTITVSRTNGGTEKTGLMFGGNQIAAGSIAVFKIRVEKGDTIDFYHSAASGTINWFIVHEAGME